MSAVGSSEGSARDWLGGGAARLPAPLWGSPPQALEACVPGRPEEAMGTSSGSALPRSLPVERSALFRAACQRSHCGAACRVGGSGTAAPMVLPAEGGDQQARWPARCGLLACCPDVQASSQRLQMQRLHRFYWCVRSADTQPPLLVSATCPTLSLKDCSRECVRGLLRRRVYGARAWQRGICQGGVQQWIKAAGQGAECSLAHAGACWRWCSSAASCMHLCSEELLLEAPI